MSDPESNSSLEEQMDQFRHEINRMIREFYVDGNPLSVFSRREWMPPSDVYETEEAVVIRIEIAGMKERDIQVILERDRLTISGKRIDHNKISPVTYRQMEIKYTNFQRVFLLPASIDEDRVTASYSDGFLTVSVLKKTLARPPSKTVRIEVKG